MRYAALLALLTLLLGFSEPAEGAGVEVSKLNLNDANTLLFESNVAHQNNSIFTQTEEPFIDTEAYLHQIGINISKSQVLAAMTELYFGSVESAKFEVRHGCFTFMNINDQAKNATNAFYRNPNLVLATMIWLSEHNTPFSFDAGITVGNMNYIFRADKENGISISESEGENTGYKVSELSVRQLVRHALERGSNGFSLYYIGGGLSLTSELEVTDGAAVVQAAELFAMKPFGIDTNSTQVSSTKRVSFDYYLNTNTGGVWPYSMFFTTQHTITSGDIDYTYEVGCSSNNASEGNMFFYQRLKSDGLPIRSIDGMGNVNEGFDIYENNMPFFDYKPDEQITDFQQFQILAIKQLSEQLFYFSVSPETKSSELEGNIAS